MADTKISGMVAATALTGAEVLPVVQSAANVKATTQQVVDAAMTTGLTRQALGSINTNTTIDWSAGSYVTATIGGALTFTFSNPAPTGNACVAYLQLTNGGSAVITWPGSVTWSGGTAPALRASGVDLLRFYTQDNGTTWFGTAENDEPDTTGLTEPLTVTRATRQSSALSAASAGETKFQFRDMAKSGLLAARSEEGLELLHLFGVGTPGLYGFYQNGTISTVVGGSTVNTTAGSGTTTASAINNSIGAVNLATAATANTSAQRYINEAILRNGSNAGDGFISWGLFSLPDSSYGSGATGVKAFAYVHAFSAIPSSNARPSGRAVGFEYCSNTDTNWQFVVNDGTNRVVDTGLAFATGTYFFMIHVPRGGTTSHGYLKNIGGSSVNTSAAYTPGSTAMVLNIGITTLDNVARNLRIANAFSLIPMEF